MGNFSDCNLRYNDFNPIKEIEFKKKYLENIKWFINFN